MLKSQLSLDQLILFRRVPIVFEEQLKAIWIVDTTVEGHLICSQFLMIINKVIIKSAYEFLCDQMFSLLLQKQKACFNLLLTFWSHYKKKKKKQNRQFLVYSDAFAKMFL